MVVPSFEYGFCNIKDIEVQVDHAPDKVERRFPKIKLRGRSVRATNRFWHSLHRRFGFTENIFKFFSCEEVFERIERVAPDHKLRYCIEQRPSGDDLLLGVSNPKASLMNSENLLGILEEYGNCGVEYSNGVITSQHSLRADTDFKIAGDLFQNRYVLETPIDGCGKPSIYLSLLRLRCSNGAVGYSPTFRSELSLGKGENRAEFAIERALDGFNNEEGFAAMRQRFESAANSWASMHEAQSLWKLLVKSHNNGQLLKEMGGDGASLTSGNRSITNAFRDRFGDFSELYGVANPDALSQKRQRTLPSKGRVYELLNFASEVATHHLNPAAARPLQAYIGDLISREYDLEGTCTRFGDWRDFLISDRDTTSTLGAFHRR
jgi:hypothetical protein